MTWTVKEAIEKAFSNPECIRVYLKSKKKFPDGKGEFYQIGYAETLESALRTFGGFLDLKAELDDEDQRIAHVFVNGDDVIRIKVETDGVEGYRFYANPKRIPETVKEALEKAFSNPDCEYVFLKAENLLIAVAKNLNDALRIFSEYLDAKVTVLDENEEEITIFISKADANIRPNPKSVETVKESKEPKMFENLKPGCVAENAEKINIQELKAFLEKKTDVVDALQQKILMLKNEIADCIEILRELEPKQAESSINILKLFVMNLEEK